MLWFVCAKTPLKSWVNCVHHSLMRPLIWHQCSFCGIRIDRSRCFLLEWSDDYILVPCRETGADKCVDFSWTGRCRLAFQSTMPGRISVCKIRMSVVIRLGSMQLKLLPPPPLLLLLLLRLLLRGPEVALRDTCTRHWRKQRRPWSIDWLLPGCGRALLLQSRTARHASKSWRAWRAS